jgi:hypothetical protein
VLLYDPALPGFALLHQPAQLMEVLSRLLAHWLGPEGQLLGSHAAVRRYVPGKRCNFKLQLMIRSRSGVPAEHRQLLGKIYTKEQGAKVYEILQELWRYGFATGRFLVPQPLAYEPAWQLLLLTWAKGELLRTLLLGDSDVCRRIDEAAGWLLKLHHSGVRSGRCYTFSRHLQTLAQQKHRMAEIYPEREGLLADLLRHIEKRGLALSGWKPGPTHRDFSPDHVVFNGAQLTGLDFDEFCQYDPLFDVAHFKAHLGFLGLSYFGTMTRFDGLAERFQAAYRAGAQDYSAPRVNLYQAIAYFKLAHIGAVVQRPPAWKEIVDALLREAQQIL